MAAERLLRPSVVQRKMTNGYRAMWAAEGEADIRTVVDTARLTGQQPLRHHPHDRRRLILAITGVGNYPRDVLAFSRRT